MDIYLARDNARLAIAAYDRGETGTREHGIYPDSQRYVDGIWALRNRFQGATT